MAAMALVPGVHLSKPGLYALNEGARTPQAVDTARALKLAVSGWWSCYFVHCWLGCGP